MTDYYEKSVQVHALLHGKMEIASKVPLETRDDMSVAYTPGVSRPCQEIFAHPERAYDLTIKRNTVAVVTDGSSVLGLGNIGPLAALPVMEGKAILFKEYAGIDAWPICLDTQDPDEVVETVRRIAPGFGGVNLEDIAAPHCFEIEGRLQDLGIPVFHDDQHGTAAVVLAGLRNACRVVGRELKDLSVVIVGAGAAGIAIARLLYGVGVSDAAFVKDLLLCDSKGIVHRGRSDLNAIKRQTLDFTNLHDRSGSLHDAMEGADAFIGVSHGNLLVAGDIRRMNKDPIIFALANPEPEIMPDAARAGGAAVIATGRSDFPNQVNNVLIFPGIFRGALDARAARITPRMIYNAAIALSDCSKNPTADEILPSPLDRAVAPYVGRVVKRSALND
ncbi:NAD-dependent malic enzyme [Chlamydiales bacterium SCGC AG-110-P3]|nr:NAD-dependent malic enzyme [Chlamydiales bacterium SCGC AG-110-P3]